MGKLLSSIFLISLFFLTGCGSSSFISIDEIKEKTGLKEIPQQSDYPEADALVLYEFHDNNLKLSGDWDLQTLETTHRVVKLFKNIEENSMEIIYLPDGESLEDIAARTIKPDGTIINLKKEDFFVTSGVGDFVTFTNDKVVRFTYPAIEKNCIVELNYTIKNDHPFMFGGWYIQSSLPKLFNSYRLTVPTLLLLPEAYGGAGWNWKYFPVNIDIPKPEETRNANPDRTLQGESSTLQWNLKNIKAFESEPEMPASGNFIQYVKFAPSELATWDDLSTKYYKNNLKDKIDTIGAVKDKALQLTMGCKTENEKINALYKYVQKFRYISVNMNNQGIIPHKASDIMIKEYGDCKDKSTLLVSLLRSIGIKAKPVLVLTADEGEMLGEFPNWNFNHMIVKAVNSDNKSYWLDATSEFHPMGQIPSMDQGIKVLVINEDGKSNIEITPQSSYEDNAIDTKIDLKIDNNFEGNYKITLNFKGEDNVNKRYYFKDKTDEEIKKYCKTLVANDVVGAEFSNCKVKYIDGDKPEVELSFEVKSKEIIQQQGDIILLTADPFSLNTNLSSFVKEKREYPVYFDYPYCIKKDITITYPQDKMTFKSFPKDVILSETGISYEKSSSMKEGNVIKITEGKRLPLKIVSNKDYKNLKSTFEKINSKSKEKIVFSQK